MRLNVLSPSTGGDNYSLVKGYCVIWALDKIGLALGTDVGW